MQRKNFERVAYSFPDFPILIEHNYISNYPDYSALNHWHNDLELTIIISGQLYYTVNGHTICLKKDNGIFVNSRQLHFGFSKNNTECEFICIVFSPKLLASSTMIEQQYIKPIIQDSNLPYLYLSSKNDWQKGIINSVNLIQQVRNKNDAPLLIQQSLFSIIDELYNHVIDKKDTSYYDISSNPDISSIKAMLNYIYLNFNKKITLEELSQVGNVSISKVNQLFKYYTLHAPIDYLIDYRLTKASYYLEKTDLPFNIIAHKIGFSGASYFSELFKKKNGITPSAYRKKHSTFSDHEKERWTL